MKTLIHQFEDFCRSKKEDEEYIYLDCSICACGQFFKSIGMYQDYIHPHGQTMYNIRHEMECLAMKQPHTFGALAERIHAFREDFNRR